MTSHDPEAGGLATAICSITITQRRRYFWAAWWSAPPRIAPFRKPDASNGGALSPEEALRDAERVAGRTLSLAPPHWARAWNRTLRGEPPFTPRELRHAASEKIERRARIDPPTSAKAILGVDADATVDELKRAYRKRALETHPDRGGDANAFRLVQASYERLIARAKKPKAKKR